MKTLIKTIGALCITAFSSYASVAQEVELNPGFISGNVQFGSYSLRNSSVTATNAVDSARTNINPTTNNFALTVPVPKNGSAEYTVRSLLTLTGLNSQISLFAGEHSVFDGQTTTVDMGYANPPLFTVKVKLPDNTSTEVSRITFSTARNEAGQVNIRNARPEQNSFPFLPDIATDISIIIRLANGKQASRQFKSVIAPQGAEILEVITLTEEESEIERGNFTVQLDFPGVDPVSQFACDGFWGSFSESPSSYNSLFYTSTQVQVGTYNLNCLAQTENGTEIRFARKYANNGDSNLVIQPNQTSVASYFAQQSFVEQYVLVSGPVGIGGMTGRLNVQGDNATAQTVAHNGEPLNWTVTPDLWESSAVQIGFAQPVEPEVLPHFGTQTTELNVTTDTGQAVPEGETLRLPDLNLDLGSITVKYRVTDGSPLSFPVLFSGLCTPNHGPYTYNFSAQGSPEPVTEGFVTVVGPASDCPDVRAVARVNGSQVTFGRVALVFEAGADQVIDINGPRITLDVAPGSTYMESTILVTGTATDDTGIASVSVNGTEASIEPTDNLDDEFEVRFQVNVNLSPGDNVLLTEATDVTGNQSSDSRSVTLREAFPLINIIHPEDNDAVEVGDTLELFARISSHSPLVSLEVNGEAVEIPTPDFNGSYEYEINRNLTVGACDSYPCQLDISVKVTDQNGGQTTDLVTLDVTEPASAFMLCEVNGDSVVDLADIRLIFVARNTSATSNDPRDFNYDGLITIHDGRGCQSMCTLPRCASVNES